MDPSQKIGRNEFSENVFMFGICEKKIKPAIKKIITLK
jgi:hypothetical protein